jgi:hypothetical protein
VVFATGLVSVTVRSPAGVGVGWGGGFGDGLVEFDTLTWKLVLPVLPDESLTDATMVCRPLLAVRLSHAIVTWLPVLVAANVLPPAVNVYVLRPALCFSTQTLTGTTPETLELAVGLVIVTFRAPPDAGGGVVGGGVVGGGVVGGGVVGGGVVGGGVTGPPPAFDTTTLIDALPCLPAASRTVAVSVRVPLLLPRLSQPIVTCADELDADIVWLPTVTV